LTEFALIAAEISGIVPAALAAAPFLSAARTGKCAIANRPRHGGPARTLQKRVTATKHLLFLPVLSFFFAQRNSVFPLLIQ
jgi:hypothetical protein